MLTPLNIPVSSQTQDRPAPAPSAPLQPPTRWATLTAAPHRITFLPGALLALLSILWWLVELLAEQRADSLSPAALPAPYLHAWLMLYALFPPFIFGFLFTAAPNWLNGPKIGRPAYIATGLLLGLGALTTLFAPLPGMLLHALGWFWGLAALVRSVTAAAQQDKRHPALTLAALVLGGLGNLLLPLWLLTGIDGLPAWAEALGLWGCLTPIFLTVCHRMVPWFTSRVVPNYVVVRPYPVLYALTAASLTHGVLQATGLPDWSWPADLTLTALCLWLIRHWGLRQSLSVRLLAMLHIAFAWAALAFALFTLDSLAATFGHPWLLGLAPLHALGMGFFGAMLIGMASRVSLGHSGYKLEADTATWRLFGLVQAAAVTRMLADWLPAGVWLIDLAAVLWLAAFAGWAWKYAPMTWRPRADGKPG